MSGFLQNIYLKELTMQNLTEVGIAVADISPEMSQSNQIPILSDNLLNNINEYNETNQSIVEMMPSVSPPNCYQFEFYLYTVAMGLLCLFGLVGNTISFLVLHKDRTTPVATFLLQVLAVVDNIFLLLWMIHYSVKSYFRAYEVTDLGAPWLYTRVVTFPLLYMAQTETIWLTVVIALNRYMAVCLPYKAPHLCTVINVYKEVIVVTAFSIAYNIPRFFEIQITHVNGTIGYERTSLWNSQIYKTVYVDALYYLFTFVLPLLILVFVNTRVTIAYQAIRKRKRRMTTNRRSENENNITLVMIVIVLIFILCQAPARIVQLVWSYKFPHCHTYQYYIIHATNVLEVLNSSVNFLIYLLCRKRFRDIIIEYVCCGPILEYHRRDSAKPMTTEGLSLAQFENTAMGRDGPRRSIKHTRSSEPLMQTMTPQQRYEQQDVNKNKVADIHDEGVIEPLNGECKMAQRGIDNEIDVVESPDSAKVPLTSES